MPAESDYYDAALKALAEAGGSQPDPQAPVTGELFPDLPRPGSKFLTGVQNSWHAIDAKPFPGCGEHAGALCGAIVRVAGEKYQPYDPYGYPVLHDRCPVCFWTVAARSGALDDAAARIAAPSGGRCLEHEITAAIVAQARAGDEEPDDPATLQLLAAVSAHAPVGLVGEACAEGACDHEGACASRAACQACSLQEGDWAGEYAGRFRDECLIEAPCAVLQALAASAGVKP